ncbi:MAG: 30S ribosome-binding factor RbfA [Planctomycetota bacterium]|nr:30S ribosome-binding factor RbfA [Planctomycetota bacterium]
MPSRRLLKAAEAIREVVSMAILTDLNDPRVRDVTVISVQVAPDMRQAKVNVSVMGNETKQNLCLRGLQSSAGFIQAKVAKRIDTRYTPRLLFVLDQGVKKSIEIATILGRVLGEEDEPLVQGIVEGESAADDDADSLVEGNDQASSDDSSIADTLENLPTDLPEAPTEANPTAEDRSARKSDGP